MRILYVCTANICRSASAQQLLRAAVAGAPELAGVDVRSAGTAAIAGASGCAVAPALAGYAEQHRSQFLTPELVEWADLVLPAAREHRSAIVALLPRARGRTFTVRQAGRIADWIVDSELVAAAREPGNRLDRYPPGDPRQEVADLPADVAQRWAWLVGEMDAARGVVPLPSGPESVPTGSGAVPGRRWRLGRAGRLKGSPEDSTWSDPGSSGSVTGFGGVDPSEMHPDDVPDPHWLGTGFHALAYEQIRASTDALVRVLREVAAGA